MRGNQRSCRWRGARLRSSTDTFQICTSLSASPESPRAISSEMRAKVCTSLAGSSWMPPNSSGTPSVRMPIRSACSRISRGKRASGSISHSRCQFWRMKGVTKSLTKARQLARIIRCSSDRLRSTVSMGLLFLRVCQGFGVHDVDRPARGVGVDLVEDLCECDLVVLARHVAEVRRAYHAPHGEQGMAGVAQRLLLVDVDCGLPGAPGPERVHQRARLDQRRAAGVDDESGRFHACEILCRYDAARRVDQTQVQRDYVAVLEERLLAGRDCAAVGARPRLRGLARPH